MLFYLGPFLLGFASCWRWEHGKYKHCHQRKKIALQRWPAKKKTRFGTHFNVRISGFSTRATNVKHLTVKYFSSEETSTEPSHCSHFILYHLCTFLLYSWSRSFRGSLFCCNVWIVFNTKIYYNLLELLLICAVLR